MLVKVTMLIIEKDQVHLSLHAYVLGAAVHFRSVLVLFLVLWVVRSLAMTAP